MQPNPPSPPSSRTRVMIGAVALLAGIALVIALIAVSHGSKSTGGGAAKAQTSPIWKPGTTWTVRVKQDSSIASPGHEGTSYEQVYDFHLAKAPTSPAGDWQVDATLVDAQGPFADGFHLYYRKHGAGFVLKQVAVGKQKPVGVEFGPTLFGQSFPFQRTITRTPVDHKVVAKNGGAG